MKYERYREVLFLIATLINLISITVLFEFDQKYQKYLDYQGEPPFNVDIKSVVSEHIIIPGNRKIMRCTYQTYSNSLTQINLSPEHSPYSIRWLKNGHEIDGLINKSHLNNKNSIFSPQTSPYFDEDGSVFSLNNAKENDSGNYQCSVANKYGHVLSPPHAISVAFIRIARGINYESVVLSNLNPENYTLNAYFKALESSTELLPGALWVEVRDKKLPLQNTSSSPGQFYYPKTMLSNNLKAPIPITLIFKCPIVAADSPVQFKWYSGFRKPIIILKKSLSLLHLGSDDAAGNNIRDRLYQIKFTDSVDGKTVIRGYQIDYTQSYVPLSLTTSLLVISFKINYQTSLGSFVNKIYCEAHNFITGENIRTGPSTLGNPLKQSLDLSDMRKFELLVIPPRNKLVAISDEPNSVNFICVPIDDGLHGYYYEIEWYHNGHLVNSPNISHPVSMAKPSDIFYTSSKPDFRNKYEILADGYSLAINEVGLKDTGFVTCKLKVSSATIQALKSQDYTAKLIVIDKPKLKGQRFNQVDKDIDGTELRLRCGIESQYTNYLTVVWYHNGNQINSTDVMGRYNELVIRNFSFVNDGIYQCFGGNLAGTDYQTFWVKVADYKPLILKGITDAIYPIDTTINLTCLAAGRPKPNITWKINDQEIKYHKELIKLNLTREILARTNDQTLSIECIFENLKGSVNSRATIKILAQTKIIYPALGESLTGPKIQKFKKTIGSGTTNLACVISHDISANISVTWYKLNNESKLTQLLKETFSNEYVNETNKPRNYKSSKYTILKLSWTPVILPIKTQSSIDWNYALLINNHIDPLVSDNGTYRCEVRSAGGNDSVDMALDITGNNEEYDKVVEDNPLNTLTLNQEFSWDDGYNKYSRNHQPYSYPYQQYPLYRYNVPDVPPQFEHLAVINSTSVKLRWKLPHLQLVPGDIIGCKVRIFEGRFIEQRLMGARNNPLFTTMQSSPISTPKLFKIIQVTGKVESALIGSLEKFRDYHIDLTCFTETGDGPYTYPPYNFRTSQDVPSRVRNITLMGTKADLAYLRWERPHELNGILTGYRIVISPIDQIKILNASRKIITNKEEILIDKLTLDTLYSANIAAETEAGTGPTETIDFRSGKSPSNPSAVIIDEITEKLDLVILHKPHLIVSVKLSEDGGSSLKSLEIQYISNLVCSKTSRESNVKRMVNKQPAAYTGIRNLFNYSIPTSNSSNLADQIKNGPFTFQINLPANFYTEYRIKIRAKNNVGYGVWSTEKTMQTQSHKPNHPPQIIGHDCHQTRGCTIAWLPILDSEWNGQPIGYSVNVTPQHETLKSNMINYVINYNTTFITLNELNALSSYHISISSKNHLSECLNRSNIIITTMASTPTIYSIVKVDANKNAIFVEFPKSHLPYFSKSATNSLRLITTLQIKIFGGKVGFKNTFDLPLTDHTLNKDENYTIYLNISQSLMSLLVSRDSWNIASRYKNVMGFGPWGQSPLNLSHSKVPVAPDFGIFQYEPSNSTLTFTWGYIGEVESGLREHYADAYELSYDVYDRFNDQIDNSDGDNGNKLLITNPRRRYIKIQNTIPQIFYNLQMVAVNSFGRSQINNFLAYTSRNVSKFGRTVIQFYLDKNEYVIRWEVGDRNRIPYPIRYYEISMTCYGNPNLPLIPNTCKVMKSWIVTDSSTYFDLKRIKLIPALTYGFVLTAVTDVLNYSVKPTLDSATEQKRGNDNWISLVTSKIPDSLASDTILWFHTPLGIAESTTTTTNSGLEIKNVDFISATTRSAYLHFQWEVTDELKWVSDLLKFYVWFNVLDGKDPMDTSNNQILTTTIKLTTRPNWKPGVSSSQNENLTTVQLQNVRKYTFDRKVWMEGSIPYRAFSRGNSSAVLTIFHIYASHTDHNQNTEYTRLSNAYAFKIPSAINIDQQLEAPLPFKISQVSAFDITIDMPTEKATKKQNNIYAYQIKYWPIQIDINDRDGESIGSLNAALINYNLTPCLGCLYGGQNYMKNISCLSSGTSTRVTITGLLPYTRYLIQMAYVTHTGLTSEYNQALAFLTSESVPSAPLSLSARNILMTSLELCWKPPANPNGIIKGYQIVYHNRGLQKVHYVKAAILRMVVKDLSLETYEFELRAKNSIGFGDTVKIGVRLGPQLGSPLPPYDVASEYALGDDYIRINWQIIKLENTSSRYYSSLPAFYRNPWKIAPEEIDGYYVEIIQQTSSLKKRAFFENPAGLNDYISEDVNIFIQRRNNLIKVIGANTHSYDIPIVNMTIGYNYSFRLMSFNEFGVSNYSNPTEFIYISSQMVMAIKANGVSKFYDQWWFLVIIALLSTLIIIVVLSFFCFKSRDIKYKKEMLGKSQQLQQQQIYNSNTVNTLLSGYSNNTLTNAFTYPHSGNNPNPALNGSSIYQSSTTLGTTYGAANNNQASSTTNERYHHPGPPSYSGVVTASLENAGNSDPRDVINLTTHKSRASKRYTDTGNGCKVKHKNQNQIGQSRDVNNINDIHSARNMLDEIDSKSHQTLYHNDQVNLLQSCSTLNNDAYNFVQGGCTNQGFQGDMLNPGLNNNNAGFAFNNRDPGTNRYATSTKSVFSIQENPLEMQSLTLQKEQYALQLNDDPRNYHDLQRDPCFGVNRSKLGNMTDTRIPRETESRRSDGLNGYGSSDGTHSLVCHYTSTAASTRPVFRMNHETLYTNKNNCRELRPFDDEDNSSTSLAAVDQRNVAARRSQGNLRKSKRASARVTRPNYSNAPTAFGRSSTRHFSGNKWMTETKDINSLSSSVSTFMPSPNNLARSNYSANPNKLFNGFTKTEGDMRTHEIPYHNNNSNNPNKFDLMIPGTRAPLPPLNSFM